MESVLVFGVIRNITACSDKTNGRDQVDLKYFKVLI